MQSPAQYAARATTLLYAQELEQRSGIMFGAKATAILPSVGMTDAYVNQFITASEALIARAIQSRTE